MKKLYIIANWKSFKTTVEAQEWLTEAKKLIKENPLPKEKILVLCVPFTLLSFVQSFIKDHDLPIHLGCQDLSPFGMGAYTGEVNAKQASEFVTYALLGHSERRNYFHETDEMLALKVQQSLENNITPILCVTKQEMPIPNTIAIAGYEPVSAIGSGHPDSPENANEVGKYVKEHNPSVKYVLYGGSVTESNVATFTKEEHIDGVIIGGASLNPQKLLTLAMNA